MDNKQVLKWNNSKRNYPKHHFMLPSPSLRQLIIGSSNCGKTCLLLLGMQLPDEDRNMMISRSSGRSGFIYMVNV